MTQKLSVDGYTGALSASARYAAAQGFEVQPQSKAFLFEPIAED